VLRGHALGGSLKILLISQYFFTREQAGSARLYEFGRRLAAAGHETTLVTTFIDNFSKEVPEKYRGRWIVREKIDGLSIVRVRAYSRYRGSYARRVVNFVSFMLMATFAALRTGPCDVVFGTTPPPTVGIVAWFVCRVRRAPLVFEVRDLWPDAAVALGLLTNPVLIRLLTATERFLCNSASAVIALTPGLKRRLVSGKGIDPALITVITNGMNPADFASSPDPQAAKRELGVPGKFVVMQAGSMGASDELDVMVRAAGLVQDDADIQFVLIGDGDAKDSLIALAAQLGLPNVTFLKTRPRNELETTLAAADILVNQIPGFYGDCALPNRMFDYLGSGRPVITTGTGDAGDLIREAGAGIVAAPGDPAALAEAVRALRADTKRRETLGAAGKAYVQARYSWEAIFPAYLALYERVGGARARGDRA
jgi:glycosyltransferase involved in cell wall biosynthesis